MTWMTEHITPRSRTTLVLVAGALAAWAVTIDRMRGMDEGPGTDLGGLGWYLGVWVTMTAAMMLPTAAPAARQRRSARLRTCRRCSSRPGTWRSGRSTASLAYGVYRLVGSLDIGQLAWDRSGPYAAGGVIVAAGLYELTPFKRMSLRRCRSAPHGNAVRSGIAHGRDCVGCSGALMAVLFVLGVMSLFWMAVIDRRHLRREGAAARSTAGARRRGGARRARNLGRRLAGDRARADRPDRLAVDADGDGRVSACREASRASGSSVPPAGAPAGRERRRPPSRRPRSPAASSDSASVQPSSRLALAFEAPRASVHITTADLAGEQAREPAPERAAAAWRRGAGRAPAAIRGPARGRRRRRCRSPGRRARAPSTVAAAASSRWIHDKMPPPSPTIGNCRLRTGSIKPSFGGAVEGAVAQDDPAEAGDSLLEMVHRAQGSAGAGRAGPGRADRPRS